MAETTGWVYGRTTLIAWTEEVKRRGGLATVFPAQAGGDLAGKPAERYPNAVISQLKLGTPVVWTAGQMFGYYKPGTTTGAVTGAKVNIADAANRVQQSTAIATGQAAETAEKIASALSFGSVLLVAGVLGATYLVMSGSQPGLRSWR